MLKRDVRLHLISMPWAHTSHPSIQVGCLKAHIDKVFGARVKTYGHHGHLSIPLLAEEGAWPHFFMKTGPFKEYPYLLLLYDEFIRPLEKDSPPSLSHYLFVVNEHFKDKIADPLSKDQLGSLKRATEQYVTEEILPFLSEDGVNLIGFSLNYNQLFASLYVERFLRKVAPTKPLLFLYGGYSSSSPQGVGILQSLGGEGYCVIGEGEKKLEKIVEHFLKAQKDGDILHIEGVIPVKDFVDPLQKQGDIFSSQFPEISSLPLPDFNKYFEIFSSAAGQNMFFSKIERPSIPMEGSRGCFAHCDFCSLNAQWSGFRKMSGAMVFERAVLLLDKYKINKITFLDNVCDTWAEDFADRLTESQIKVGFFMEMRAHHPEAFWSKLARAGLSQVQIGIESFAPSLLKKIGKGTRVIQNVRAQKYLAELKVPSHSNLIIQHPRSTLADVIETQRIIEATTHFPLLRLVHFSLEADSPLFNSLSEREKNELETYSSISFDGPLSGVSAENGYLLPPSLRLPAVVQKAWAEFKNWHRVETVRLLEALPSLSCTKLAEAEVRIIDTRSNRAREIYLSGDEALLYNFCHRGPNLKSIQLALNLDELRLLEVVRRLIAENLLLEIEGSFLSLALRPRAELLANLDRASFLPPRSKIQDLEI